MQDKNCFLYRNRTVSRRNIYFVGKLSIVRLVLLQNVVDGSQQHSGNSDDSLSVTTTLVECKVTISDFRNEKTKEINMPDA